MSEQLEALAAMVITASVEQLLAQPRNQDARSLARFRSRVYSQDGEDGAIAEMLRRVGEGERTFVEIGAGDGEENCTRFLLEQGWRGIWLECDAGNVAKIRAGYAAELASGQLELVAQPITRENAHELVFRKPYRTDVLVIDIDMNTAHVWRALSFLQPRIAVIEYNAAIPPSVDWVVPYDPAGVWQDDNYYGASLKHLERLGADPAVGLRLVGCELAGVNAYFVRKDLASERKFLAPFTAERHHEPQRCLPPLGFPARPRARMNLKEAA